MTARPAQPVRAARATTPTTVRSRGVPLVMLALLLTAWTGARALWWDNPFAGIGAVLNPSVAGASSLPAPAFGLRDGSPALATQRASAHIGAIANLTAYKRAVLAGVVAGDALAQTAARAATDPRFSAAHQVLQQSGLRGLAPSPGNARGFAAQQLAAEQLAASGEPPYLAAPPPSSAASGQRWSLDTWAFWRQDSAGAPASQGRAPIYGASQLGAVLQYRLAPLAKRDPRLYARAYRALVQDGESELALGVSARPFALIPIRIAAEARLTDAAFRTEVRPSASAITEIAPIRLPYGAHLEAYGQAGWVGGATPTAFADGQASVSREVAAVAAASGNAVRLSVGAGAWGGAQQDAQRIDVGPTMRLDLTVGDVPARLSLDWRERVGGAAGPDSGLAATLSTRF